MGKGQGKKTMDENKGRQKRKGIFYLCISIFCLIIIGIFISVKLETPQPKEDPQQWNKALATFLDADAADMERLKEACSFPDVKIVKKDGFTARVVQTLADRHVTYYACEITFPEAFVGVENLKWESDIFDIVNGSTGKMELIGGIGMTEVEGNKMTIVGYSFDGRLHEDAEYEMQATLENLGSVDSNGNWTELAPITLSFSWEVTFADIAQKYDVNQAVEGTEKVVEQIEISPLSVWATVSGVSSGQGCMPMITYEDGHMLDRTLLPGYSFSFPNLDTPDERDYTGSKIGYIFENILDLSTVEKVTSAGIDVKIE